MKTVAVFLAPGFEEVEAVTPIDFLRRAGIQVVTVGTEGALVRGSRGVVFQADILLNEVEGLFDGVILPGGMPGAINLSENEEVTGMVQKHLSAGKLVGAICAAPAVVLGSKGFLQSRNYTCYPGFETSVDGEFQSKPVVQDKNLITSRGPGTASLFALKIIEYFKGSQSAQQVHKATLQLV